MKRIIALGALLASAVACSSPASPTTARQTVQPPDTTTVPPGTTDPGVVPPLTAFRQNLPTGWAAVLDYGFSDQPPTHRDGVETSVSLGSSGLTALDWGHSGGGLARLADSGAPYSPDHVLAEIYPPHLSGTGPSKVSYYLPNEPKVYISWVVKWEPGFDHNPTSEKMLYINLDGTGDQFLFEYTYGVEMIQYIREVSGYEALRANQMIPNWAGHGDAPPVNGIWLEFELLFDQSTGTVRWWRNGQLRAAHSGVSFTPLRRIDLDATWGGGGDKQGSHSRYTDHLFIAVGN